MAAQALWQPGVIQYLSYPHGPIPPGHHGPLKARVTWRPSGPNTPQPRQVPLQQDAKFYLFSELPLEIRLKIWNFASPPRVIEIRSWGNNIANRFRPVKFSTPPQKPPIIFRINHESREEAVRLYTVVEIGISVSILDPSRQYVDWKLHSMNSYRRRMHFFHHDVSNLPLATPYPAQKTYINFCRDTIYLGPEFQSYHLESLLTATGPKMELSGLQYLAMDKKLWTASVDARWHMGHLRAALYSLRSRPIKEIYIVTDDLKEALPDKFYYREHEITLHDAPYEYEFDLSDKGEKEKTVVQNLEGWFERLWKDKDTEKEAPKVEVKSVRRDGRSLSSFKDGIWEVQKVMGGMES